MNQPRFTWWPWKILSLSVPLIALGCAALAKSDNKTPREVLAVFFSVVAAANGYLFAMAVGDFGRSVTAIPIGALAGYTVVYLFAFPLTNAFYVFFLFIVAWISISQRVMQTLPGCLMMILLFFAFLAYMGAAAHRRQDGDPQMCVFSSFPFVCACVTASMPVENSIYAVWQAMLAGTRSALHGMIIGGASSILAWIVAAFIISGPRATRFVGEALLVGVPLMLINYFTVKNLFTAVHRVEVIAAPKPRESVLLNERDGESGAM